MRPLAPRLARALPLALAALSSCEAGPPPAADDLRLDGEALGTRWMVRVRRPGAADAAPAAESVRRAIRAELDAVDRSMSNWRADSELSSLNESRETGPIPLSEPLALVLEAALRVHEDSGGAFDITVGPLLRLFGFGPEGDPDQPPPDAETLAAARLRVGSDLLSVERLPDGAAVLHRGTPEVVMDLSGIAKGYAVDRVSAALAGLGNREHLVEVGGEIRAAGRWSVGVEDPSGGLTTRIHRSFPVEDLALATSGGYRDFRAAGPAAGGRVWTHIFDPRTGRPTERRAGSVTVIAEDCLEADAWATALFVLGPEEGLDLAERRGLRALFLTAAGDDGAVEEAATTAFRRAAGSSLAEGRMGR